MECSAVHHTTHNTHSQPAHLQLLAVQAHRPLGLGLVQRLEELALAARRSYKIRADVWNTEVGTDAWPLVWCSGWKGWPWLHVRAACGWQSQPPAPLIWHMPARRAHASCPHPSRPFTAPTCAPLRHRPPKPPGHAPLSAAVAEAGSQCTPNTSWGLPGIPSTACTQSGHKAGYAT